MLEIDQVQGLNNRDAVAAFFERLGYNVKARLEQTPANLGVSPESVVRRIKRTERIANQDDYFQVYLFEVDSVTVELTRSLARTFRDFQGHYLLVLTSDYEQIDFVLVETLLATGDNAGPMQAQRKRGFRPLVLSVKRRAPTRVDRRVIARFEYTEADPLAQYDKLLSAYSVAYWSEEHFNNRALFSDYYLLERLRERQEWQEDATPAYRAFERLLANEGHSLSGKNEENARTALFEPAFSVLGFVAKEGKKAADGVEDPDYVLCDSSGNTPVTLALTYCWNRNLDGPDETRDPDTPQENPSQTVITVLEKSAHDWAIVTNGKTWRLYSKKAHSRATNYYEVDLPEIMALSSPSEAFRYFWLFFRAASFEPAGAGAETKCLLDELLEGSHTYAKKLGERLKDQVFREIFPHFAAGFVAGMGGSGALLSLPAEERSSRLADVYQGTLTFLYRLLFLSYAEARDLLPVKERRGYYLKSLLRMKEEIRDAAELSESARAAKIGKHFSETGRGLYDRLTELFALINKGDPAVNLPTYNGGLFITDSADQDDSDGAAHARFLRDHFIPDRHLAMGLDLLARVEDEKKLELVFIDYKSLGVRQLGSIYEGLLEFKVEIATEKLGVTKEKGNEVFCPWSELGDRERKAAERRGDVIPEGGVYLSNDKRERKATGSYYTPDYIVEYIVQHAVGPVLHEKFEALRPKLREAQRRYRDSVELNRQRAKAGQKTQDPDVVVGDSFKELAEELFDVKIVDPAMGSGHFLVEVVDYVTDRMIDFLNGFPWNPVAARLRRMRESILEHMDESGISVDHGRLTDTNLLKRHVLKRCVYGVDINPMAVELAKVSLWLDCFTLGAPLSFLDHHLKCGNSLIGTDIETVQKAVETEQLLLFSRSQFAGVMLGADLMRQVGRLSDVTVEQMNQSRREYKRARDELAAYKRLLDVYVSRWFGNEPVKMAGTVRDKQSGQARKGRVERDYAAEFLQSEDAERWSKHPDRIDGMEKLHRQIAERTMIAAKQQRFFHWELEFPEVYYGPRPGTTQMIERLENAGFDAVVGNPPYGLLQGTDLQEPLRHMDPDIFSGSNDIAHFFLKRASKLVKISGIFSFIVTRYWLEAHFTEGLRHILTTEVKPQEIIDFGNLQVWPDVNVLAIIAQFVRNEISTARVFVAPDTARVNAKQFLELCELDNSEYLHVLSVEIFTEAAWRFRGIAQEAIWGKLRHNCIGLGSIATNTQGIKTGNNDAFTVSGSVVQDEQLERPFLVPLVQAEDIGRYDLNEKDDWLIYLCDGHDIKKTPNIYRHLLRFKEALCERAECNKGQYEWWRLQRARDPKIVFNKKRLLVPLYSTYNRFYPAETQCVAMTDVYVIVTTDKHYDIMYLAAVLNSKLLTVYHRTFCKIKRAGYLEYSGKAISELPVRKIDFSVQHDHSWQEIVSEGKTLCESSLDPAVAAKLLGLVNDCIASPNDKSVVIHDWLVLLARDMVMTSRKSILEQNRFLKWLSETLNIESQTDNADCLAALAGRSQLRNFIGNYQKNEVELSFSEVEQILFKNRSRLGVNLSDAGLVRKLREEYEKSLATLLPLKLRLAATDALIDQIVYRLYGLTDEEIAIVEGKDVDKKPVSGTVSIRTEAAYLPVSRKDDPRELREILTAASLLGPATLVELIANVKDRALISFGFDEAESVVREFTRLGWLKDAGQARIALTETAAALLKGPAGQSPYTFARDLALAHETVNGRIVSRILSRLWELNPDHQGAVIIPKPQLPENVSLDPDAIADWMTAQAPKWLEALKSQMPGFVPTRKPEELVMLVREASASYGIKQKATVRPRERFGETVAEQFLEMLFEGLKLPARDLNVWRGRLDWAGLTMTARTLPGVAGWVWFPLGAFRKDAGEGFQLVKELVFQDKPLYVHEPDSQAFETKFLEALYQEYASTSREERVEYVPLTTVRDRTCYRLRIGAGTFERVLASVFPKAVRGDVPYGMALEVDITPQERNRLRNVIPIVIDHTPRYIIAMRKK